jgi:hypothetical protein
VPVGLPDEYSRKRRLYQIPEVMQHWKAFEDEKQMSFSLPAHLPAHNFYRRLRQRLNLGLVCQQTQAYYGNCGQQVRTMSIADRKAKQDITSFEQPPISASAEVCSRSGPATKFICKTLAREKVKICLISIYSI